jgi:hypothetical protein
MVNYAFLFDTFAITVEPCVVLDPHTGDEHGARIQIRRVQTTAESDTHVGEPIWRGDLFRLTDGPPDNWDRAHYHPRFQGLAAGPRHEDPALKKDPFSWALAQLSDLHALGTQAAAPDLVEVSPDLQSQVNALHDEIRVALNKCAAQARPTPTTT